MELFPAILIGGPPHSGKSVLAYSLSQALRRRGLAHYLLRACPDGEGDWANEIDQGRARVIRVKGRWSQDWVDYVCRDIARRRLPLLVDVGGRPESWQEPIFSQCSHAVLLAPTVEALAGWQAYAQRHGLTVLAELESSLTLPAHILAGRPIFRARLHGLERGSLQSGPVFEALVEKLSPYFNYPAEELRRIHLAAAPVENAIDLDEMARLLGLPFDSQKATWQPGDLAALLGQLPGGERLALYGRGPNWLYAAVALQAWPAEFFQFDPRLGWISPPALKPGGAGPLLAWQIEPRAAGAGLSFSSDSYLDYWQAGELAIPAPPDGPLIIGGRLPHWLLAGLALAYRDAPLLAVHQPQTGNVVIQSRLAGYTPGDLFGTSSVGRGA